jgi:hypothetical protein
MRFGGAALVVVVAGYLARTDPDMGARWRTVGRSVGGGVLFAAALWASTIIRSAEGQPVGEPQFALLVASSTVTPSGFAVGVRNTRARNDTARAERARDRFELLYSMLRHDVLNAMTIVQPRAEFSADEKEGRPADYASTIETQTDDEHVFGSVVGPRAPRPASPTFWLRIRPRHGVYYPPRPAFSLGDEARFFTAVHH